MIRLKNFIKLHKIKMVKTKKVKELKDLYDLVGIVSNEELEKELRKKPKNFNKN